MWQCNDCGLIFEVPKRWKESRGEFWGQPAYEEVSGCPHCYSGDYDEYREDDYDEEEGEEENEDDDG